MMTNKYISEKARAFRVSLKSGDLNAAQFALEDLQHAIDSLSRELDSRWELREAWQKVEAQIRTEAN